MRKSIAPPKTHRIGIKWKMYAILIVFVGIIVGVVWFFQVQLMNYFYQVNKFNELEISAQAISAELREPSELESIAKKYASEYYTDIWVYHINRQGVAHLLAEAGDSAQAENTFITQKFAKLYDKAVLNEGLYIALVPQEQFWTEFELQIIKDNSGAREGYPIVPNHTSRISAVYVSVRTIDQHEYMIIQTTELTPIQAMVKTLKNQALWIGFILSIFALIMAVLMSKLITKPIVKMNEAAKQLAQGRYDADFFGHGYREIDELAQSLNYAACELAKTDHLQKELISNISHDLRTPLTMIKGYGEVMRDIPGENTPENIQIIIDETSRLSELVNDMLDLSRIQAGTRQPQYDVFSLTETVRSTLLRYERLTKQQGYKIDFSEDGEVEVLADRSMILQVIYNLINNAINYTGEDHCVSVRQQTREDRVRISVTDTGEGISEEEIPLIWDRYYKIDKVHKRAMVGTGLGLSIVKEILELHHAAYGVTSTLGKGSEFWFELTTVSPERKNLSEPDYLEASYE